MNAVAVAHRVHPAKEARKRWFEGPAGRLDARLHGPDDGPPLLLLHPHPRFGGSMGSRLVFDLAVALGGAGWRTVRFDFRGVGRSDGAYGHGEGEAQDAAAVFDALQEEAGSVPAVVGYSFGGGVALRLAAQHRVARLVLVATPVHFEGTLLDPPGDASRVECPTHLVVGTGDGFVSVADAQRLAAAFRGAAELKVLQGAGHFLEPSHNRRAVAAVLEALGGPGEA